MKLALKILFTLFCLIFSLIWMGLMAYGMGMGGMGGSLGIPKFSEFWMKAPVVISIISAIAVWFPASNRSKIIFAICLFVAAGLSLILRHDGIFQEKLYTILLGTAPLSILLASLLVVYFSNKNSHHANQV